MKTSLILLLLSCVASGQVVNPFPRGLVPAGGATGPAGPTGPAGSGNNAFCSDATGSTTAYTCPTPSPVVTTLAGLIVSFVPQTTNTGASTLNIAALGAKSLTAADCATTIASGALKGGTIYTFAYNGSVLCQSSVTSRNVIPVSFSATPAFNVSAGDQSITLTGNITSFTVTGVFAGQPINFLICQDATGSRTISGIPANIHGLFTIGSTASKCNTQSFESFDGVNLYAINTGVINQ